jgi:hypothetical protein
MVDILPEGPASQTGSELLRFGNIVAFNPQNPIVPDMQPERTAPAAVESGRGSENFNFAIGLVHTFTTHFSLLINRRVGAVFQFLLGPSA